MTLGAPEALGDHHDLDSFAGGVDMLDGWLRRRARANERAGAARTFVIGEGLRVVGYYCLAAGSVSHRDTPGSVRRNMPDPVPTALLGRLAVDRGWQRRGLGAALLSDAVLRVLGAAGTIGIRALLVHAISEDAAAFYERHGFARSPLDPLILMVTMREAQRMLDRGPA